MNIYPLKKNKKQIDVVVRVFPKTVGSLSEGKGEGTRAFLRRLSNSRPWSQEPANRLEVPPLNR